MTKSPVVKFGICAQAVAMNAKTNRLRDRDIMDLARQALEFSATDRRVRQPVLEFIDTYKMGPVEAGQKLQSFILRWIREVAPDAATQVEFDWQKRADIR